MVITRFDLIWESNHEIRWIGFQHVQEYQDTPDNSSYVLVWSLFDDSDYLHPHTMPQ